MPQIENEYREFGPKWSAEMMRFKKKSLIGLYAEACQKVINVEARNAYLNSLVGELVTKLSD